MSNSKLKLPSDSSGQYNYEIVRLFTVAAVFWGLFGFFAGVYIALQLAFPALNLNLEWTSFGRLRPIHTSSVIFAFGGNILFATSLFVIQRTSQARLWGSNSLHKFIFWGYQIFLIMALYGYLNGITQAKEYAEPEWYADLFLLFVWIAYFTVFLMTLKNRKEPHIYVANWFYLAFIVAFGAVHIVNNLAIPLRFDSSTSYPIFSGVQSAMIQWWYGHNAVGFFLTAGFIGIMYYFIPKRANRPVYSYRLSILHFWSLIFIYIWAGPHHLHYTSLPDWVQTLGMTFSIMLWMPSWGGMINGIMTLSGAWDKLRTDPVMRFLITAVAFYGMSTFEGPMMAIKSVNALSHYTEWTISHVHSGSLGWVALISFGALYHLVPILWGKKNLYSNKLVSTHFWLASIGIVLYITSMWIAGIMQGLMWRSYDELGFLQYSFVEVVKALHPLYFMRAVGGLFFFSGAVVMAYNLYKTTKLKNA
ncbi:MAG: cytochrome-c oxidase, cbb3-type subunit I [Rickettsiales bacterium]|jgi:cytochrome c oxidase cbb3-type subunit I|nr:cytochrome-c oxidase, cbb3-type subunit I [Rickettsiales bacterium]MDA9573764.1 cytochrome-c oxidase, cbb3-type subunit I [Rickettsiales bacterium]|tara:strand:+ start:9160 stop:10584 length:1425 start_codon:yes stop_codon:yes gene_type:complete